MFDPFRAKVETKRSKSKDQVEETLVMALKKIDKLFEDLNISDMLYMNKFTTSEESQKSNFVPKNKPFVKKPNEEGKQGPPHVPNT